MTIKVHSKRCGDQLIYFDATDAPIVLSHRWYITTRHYAATTIKGKTVLMHRLLLQAGPGQVVDHRNHHTLDNRRGNIWLCTQRENQANRLDNKNSKTGMRGIHPFRNKYKVQIGRRYVGIFDTLDEAAAARSAAA